MTQCLINDINNEFIGQVAKCSDIVPPIGAHLIVDGVDYKIAHIIYRNNVVGYMAEWRVDLYVLPTRGHRFNEVAIPQSDGMDRIKGKKR